MIARKTERKDKILEIVIYSILALLTTMLSIGIPVARQNLRETAAFREKVTLLLTNQEVHNNKIDHKLEKLDELNTQTQVIQANQDNLIEIQKINDAEHKKILIEVRLRVEDMANQGMRSGWYTPKELFSRSIKIGTEDE